MKVKAWDGVEIRYDAHGMYAMRLSICGLKHKMLDMYMGLFMIVTCVY